MFVTGQRVVFPPSLVRTSVPVEHTAARGAGTVVAARDRRPHVSTQDTLTRSWQDLEVPPPGNYQIDPAHTTIEFIARHLMIAKARGRFTGFSGQIHIDEDPARSSVEVSIDADTIDTAEEDRDTHLRSPDFLDVERWPNITFRGGEPEHVEGQRWRVPGELTVRDVTRPVELDATLEGVARDPWGNTRVIFSAATTIDREDFDVTWNQVLESGGVMVGKRVTAEIEAQAVLQE